MSKGTTSATRCPVQTYNLPLPYYSLQILLAINLKLLTRPRTASPHACKRTQHRPTTVARRIRCPSLHDAPDEGQKLFFFFLKVEKGVSLRFARGVWELMRTSCMTFPFLSRFGRSLYICSRRTCMPQPRGHLHFQPRMPWFTFSILPVNAILRTDATQPSPWTPCFLPPNTA